MSGARRLTSLWARLTRVTAQGTQSAGAPSACSCSASRAAPAVTPITANVRGFASSAEAQASTSGFSPASLVLFLPSAICGALTYWQLERKNWKDDLIRRRREALQVEPKDIFTAESLEPYDKVTAEGVLVHDRSIYVGPRPRSIPGQGVQSGYLLVTPLQNTARKGVVLVNRGWVPASWRSEAPRPLEKPEQVVGVVQPDEQPSSFVSRNNPDSSEFHYIDVPNMAASLGLPPDTPLIMCVSDDPSTLLTRNQSPLEQSRSEPVDTPTFPIPKNQGDLVRFVTMPEDHLIYAGTWATLCVSLALMARAAVLRPQRSWKLVGARPRAPGAQS